MISYILFNTLVYGGIAFMLSSYFGYAKYLNVTVGSFMILSTYTLAQIVQHGRSAQAVSVCCGLVLLYWLINYIVIRFFPNAKQRDLFWLIFTLGGSLFLGSATNMIYWPLPTSVQWGEISTWRLVAILVAVNLILFYIFHTSYIGKIRKGIYHNTWSIRSLGIKVNSMLHVLFMAFIPCFIALGVLIANEGTLRASDNMFYMIKGLGIMIVVGVEKKQYIFLGALAYVILEYLMFIKWWLPISYKETLILVIILIILLCKPEGLLTTSLRKI